MNKGTLIINGIDYSNGGGTLVTKEIIEQALGYTPANEEDIPTEQVNQNTSDIAYYEERGFLTKNIININNSTLSYNIDDSGNGGTNTLVDTSDFIEAKPSTSYVFSFYRNQANGYIRIHEFNANRQWIKLALKDTALTTDKQYDEIFTTSANCAYIRICYENKATDVILSEGSQPISYVPFAKSNVELTEDIIKTKVYGNSIVDLSSFVKGRIDNGVIGYADGTTLIEKQGYNLLIVTNSAYRGAVSGLTPVDSNATYNYSFDVNGTLNTSQIHYYSESGSYISYTNIYNQSGTVTIPANAKYIRWAFLLGSAQTCLINSFVLSNEKSLIPSNKDLYISKTDNEIVTDLWNSNTTYAVGSYCIYSNALWKCLTQNKGVAPVEGSNWTKTSLSDELKPISIPVSSFITLNSNITSASTRSHIYKVGNHITGTLHLNFKNAFTGLTVGTIENGYRPSNPEILTAFSGSNMWAVCNSMYAHLATDGVLSINNVNGHADQNACMIWLDYFI